MTYEHWQQMKRCVCPSPDRRDCIQIRYDIHENPADPWDGLIDDACECVCHDEYEEAGFADWLE